MSKLVAYDEATGDRVEVGERLVSKGGARGTLTALLRGGAAGKSGKVTVLVDGATSSRENYDFVWGLEVVDE